MESILTPGNIIVAAIVVIALFFGIRRMVRGIRGTGGCGCGCEDGAAPRRYVEKAVVADTDEANYPYSYDMQVGGMSCEGCVGNVENALNALPGTWAQVDLESGRAHIRCKAPVDVEGCEAAVRDAGYYVVKI